MLSNPGVTVALSGMQNLEQLEENVATVSNMGEMTEEDHERIRAAITERKEFMGLYCTGCGYCMPCPAGVDIPKNFEILNLKRRIYDLDSISEEREAALESLRAVEKVNTALLEIPGRTLERLDRAFQHLEAPCRSAWDTGIADHAPEAA